ncbi:MAG: helix-turn-helix domain-containing protein [Saprospiraceae bacterium]
MSSFLQIQSISKLHQMVGYEKPKHPLITVLDYAKIKASAEHFNVKIVTDLYIISLKSPAPKVLQYGRQYYDFEEGTMMFMAPGQVFSVGEFNEQIQYEGWGLWFHPDLIVNTALGKKIKDFSFFAYAVSEALHLSEDEKNTLTVIVDHIQKEYNGNIDQYSHNVIITSIEQLLNYSQRFYGRQFITRKKQNSDLLSAFEDLVSAYFKSAEVENKGLPSVEYFAGQLNLSASYLSDLLKKETGKTTKEYLQIQIIETAKNRLLNSRDTVNEIAYSLGFEYPQYFIRLFKSKTGMTPLEYRQFN